MSTDNKETVVRFLDEVWSRGNIEAVGAYLAPRYTIHHDPGDPWHGRTLDVEGFKDRVRQSRAPFPDQRFTIQELIAEGDRVAVTWSWAGTHRQDIPGSPASGKHITMSGITVYSFDGSRICGHWQVTDRLGVYQQLNVSDPS